MDSMSKSERVSFAMAELESLYPCPPIPLDHRDSYTLLVAVLLSAQCTDKRVNTVTPALFDLADNPRDMARQDVDAIRAIIRPCGLSPRRTCIEPPLNAPLNALSPDALFGNWMVAVESRRLRRCVGSRRRLGEPNDESVATGPKDG